MKHIPALFVLFVVVFFGCKKTEETPVSKERIFDANMGIGFDPNKVTGRTFNGRIEFEAREYEGAKFTIIFPVMPGHGTDLPYIHPITFIYEKPGARKYYRVALPNPSAVLFSHDTLKNTLSMSGTMNVNLVHLKAYNNLERSLKLKFENLSYEDSEAPPSTNTFEFTHISPWEDDTFALSTANLNLTSTADAHTFNLNFPFESFEGFSGSTFTFEILFPQNMEPSDILNLKDKCNSNYKYYGQDHTVNYGNFMILRNDPLLRRITVAFAGDYQVNFFNYNANLEDGFIDFNY